MRFLVGKITASRRQTWGMPSKTSQPADLTERRGHRKPWVGGKINQLLDTHFLQNGDIPHVHRGNHPSRTSGSADAIIYHFLVISPGAETTAPLPRAVPRGAEAAL